MDDQAERETLEREYAAALEDGPVVLCCSNEMKGFADLASACAYLEAINIAAGKKASTVLVVGPNSAAALTDMLNNDAYNE